jgi:hypothetical protein
MKYRISVLQKWNCWEKELREKECALHESLHPCGKKVLSSKNLLFLEKLLQTWVGRIQSYMRRYVVLSLDW